MNDAKMSQTEKLPCLFVIFGATGDLASNKLLPALFELENAGRLADNFSIVAFSRREWTTDDWLEHLREILKNRIDQSFPEGVLERFFARFRYQQGDLNDIESYRVLAAGLAPGSACSRTVFYLAIRPADFVAVIRNLKAAGLNEPRGMNRVVIENRLERILNRHRY